MLPRASLFGLDVKGDRAFYYVIFICFVILTWVAVNLIRTRFGRALSPSVIMTGLRRAWAFPSSNINLSLLPSVPSMLIRWRPRGLLYRQHHPRALHVVPLSRIHCDDHHRSLGSIPGAVFGAIFITLLNEILSQSTQFFMNIEGLAKIALTIAPLREFVFGLAIVLFIIFEPKGLAEVWRIIRSGFRLWPFSY